MSDDERMDRAKRIRRMREGQREDSGDSEDSADGSSDDEATADEDPQQDDASAEDQQSDDQAASTDPSQETDGSTEAAAETDETDESADRPDETDESTPPSDEQPQVSDTDDPTDATTQHDGGSVDTGDDTDDTVEEWDDAVDRPASAEGADQSQENSMNDPTPADETDVSSETDDDAPDPQAIAQRAAEAAASVTGGSGTETASQSSEDQSPVAAAAESMQGAANVDLPDQEQLESAMEAAGGSAETVEQIGTGTDGPGPGTVEPEQTATTEESTRVLEFTLGDEHYCIDISLVEEIVKRDSITRVPNTDEYIEGVVDLRGQITTILDPKALLDIDAEGSETLMIVFDPDAFEDQGAIGWIVDEVRQVAPIRESEVNDPPVHEDYIRGVVDREDSEEFVIWTKPEIAIKLATIDESED